MYSKPNSFTVISRISTAETAEYSLVVLLIYHFEKIDIFDSFVNCRLELWPGYTTSILPYETDVLLSADVSHKVLRQTTVLEYLYDLYGETSRDFHNVACKKLVGQIVLTRYCILINILNVFSATYFCL